MTKRVFTLLIYIIPICIVAFIHYFNILGIVLVVGNSMNPTLHDGQYLAFSSLHKIEKNDVAVFKSPHSWKSSDKNLIKRVVGVPGDTVKITDKDLYINEEHIVSFGDNGKINSKPIEICLCDDNYFVLGDNYKNSYDSLARYLDSTRGDLNDWTIFKEDILFGSNIERVKSNE